MPRLASLMVYPVQGCRGVRVKGRGSSASGLEGEHTWHVDLDDSRLGKVWVEEKGAQLVVSAAGHERLTLTSKGTDAEVTAASAWFTKYLGSPVNASIGSGSGELRAVTLPSLAALNQAQGTTLTVEHFRPHFVFEGADAGAEKTWKSISLGGVRFDVLRIDGVVIHLKPVLAAPAQLRAGQSLDVS